MKTSLNHTYRLVWSDALQTFVPVAECARGRGKGGKKSARARSLMLGIALLAGAAVHAQLPTGGQVTAGSASMATQGKTLTITQTSDRMAADWQSFSIGQGHTVNFVQPGSHAVALNRVLGSDVSVIQGALNANGQVFLVNPNGVLFTKDAQVNVGGIVASTLNISTQDFMAGNYKFEGASSNAIVNQGRITAHGNGQGGGTVALIAARINNEGALTAEKGNVLMGAGRKVTLDLGGPVKIQVEEGALDALIEQGGAIKADGGLVYLSAKSAGDLVSTVINHTGITEAQTLATGEKGEIYLMGDMARGQIEVGGTLKAEGGFVETSAAKVEVQAGTQVQAGHWLLDPTNITVDSALASTLQGQLASGAATVTTASVNADAGDITVNSGITWTSGNTLTLRADRNITVNATLDASGGSGGKLALQYGQAALAANNTATYTINAPVNLKAGANFSTKLGSDGATNAYTVVTTADALQAILWSGRYALGSNINLQGRTWTPFGTAASTYKGSIDGLGHTISNLTHTGTSFLGLVGNSANADFRNLNLDNFTITSTAAAGEAAYAGALSGRSKDSSFYNIGYKNITVSGGSNTFATGEGTREIGGLLGSVSGAARISQVRGENITLNGLSQLGGLAGTFYPTTTDAVSDVQLKGVTITIGGYAPLAANNVGGLMGRFESRGTGNSKLTRSGVSNVDIRTKAGQKTNGNIGGLIGGTYKVSITESYSSGSVVADNVLTSTNWIYGGVGGLVGVLQLSSLENTYAQTAVTLNGNHTSFQGLGGLVGHAADTSSIINSYSTGQVSSNMTGTAAKYIGGFLGSNKTANGLTLVNNFWDNTSSGRSNAIGSGSTASTSASAPIALTTINRYTQATYTQGLYTDFDFTNVWRIYAGWSYPVLRALQNTLTVQANNQSKVFDGSNHSGGNGVLYFAKGAPVTPPTLTGSLSFSGTSQGARNVGSYAMTPGGYTGITRSTQQDYQDWHDAITYVGGTLTITAKPVSITGLSAADKVYDATTNATLTGTAAISGLSGADAVSVSGTVSGSFADKNVGTAKPITLTGLSLTGADASNYSLSLPSLTANITKASLSLSGLTAADKTFDGTTTAKLSGSTSITPLGTDDVALSGVITGSFADANAGSGKTVTIPSVTLVGKDAGNYSFTSPSGLTATINKAPLLITANDFVSSASTTPSVASQSGCALIANCVSGISLSGGALGLSFANGQLASNYNTTLQLGNATGRLEVNRPLSWSGFNLTLSAATDIHINNTLTASGASDKVTLRYGQGAVAASNTAAYRFGLSDTGFAGKLNLLAGQNLSTKLGRDGTENTWTVLTDQAGLQNINNGLSGRYALGANVDASGSEWTTLGNATTKFTGQFDGLGHTVSGLTITKTSDVANNYQGLFGYTNGASLANIGMETPTITAARFIGGLVGQGDATSITQSYVKNATLTGERGVGGLAGYLRLASNVADTFATGVINGNGVADISFNGGLVGLVEGFTAGSGNPAANIRRSFANVNVTPTGTATRVAGGLVGLFRGAGEIEDSFALGSVSGRAALGADGVGGLVGRFGGDASPDAPTMTRSYASGAVTTTGGTIIGGLIGYSTTGTVTDSVWNTDTTGRATSAGGAGAVGKTSEQMQTLNTFANWNAAFTDATSYAGISDFRQPGIALDGSGQWRMNPKYIPYTLTTIGTGNYTYNAQAQTPVQWDSKAVLGTAFANWVLGTDYKFTHSGSDVTGFTNAGTYNPVSVSILRSGYNNASAGNTTGSLTIDKAALTVRANDDARFVTQTDNTGYAGVSYSGFKGSDTASVLGTPTITRSDSGNNNTGSYTLTPSGLSSVNYAFSYQNGSYQIVGADKMLVKAGTVNSIYGQTVDWTTPTVQYVAGGSVLDLVKQSQAGAAFVFQESATPSNTVSFTLGLTGTTLSGSSNVKAGTYVLAGTGFADNTSNYNGGEAGVVYSGKLVVAPKAITVSYSASKTYDAGTSLTPSSVTSSGIITNDVVSFSGSGSFTSKNAGSNLGYSLTVTPDGADKDNYVISNALTSGSNFLLSGSDGAISKANLTVSGLTASNKVYDGSVNTPLGGTASVTALGSDSLSLTGKAVGVFADKNVGNGKAVTVSGVSLAGTDAGNYTLTQQSGLTANITAASISAITGITAADKTYDGTTDTTLNSDAASFTGMVVGDTLTVASATGAFADKNAGAGKTVNITGLALGGTDAGNYTLASTTASTTATIVKAGISAVTGITAADKTYDGSTSATLDSTSASFTGRLDGDALTVSTATGAFEDKNAATGKTVSISGITLGGADAGNYQLTSDTATATAAITPKALTMTGSTAQNKTYDGSTTASVSPGTLSGFVGDETVLASASGEFNSKDVASANSVTATYTLANGSNGGLASNYSLAAQSLAVSISAREISVGGLTVNDKVYDGTTTATLGGTASITPLDGDIVSLTGTATGAFADKNVGYGKEVTISGLGLAGAQASNYSLAAIGAMTANITPKTLVISGSTVADKVYDGTTVATVTPGTLSGFVGSETVGAVGLGDFNDKNAGPAKPVTVYYNLVDGTNGGLADNYRVAAENLSAAITRASISAVTGITAADKTYDGSTSATLNTGAAGFTGLVANDSLSVAGARGVFADSTVGTGKTVNITDISLGGTDASNYTLASTTATTAASIIAAPEPTTTLVPESVKVAVIQTAQLMTVSGVASGPSAGGSGMAAGSLSSGNAVLSFMSPVTPSPSSSSVSGGATPQVTVSGGLRLVSVDQESAAGADNRLAQNRPDRSLGGFVTVTVVRGGISGLISDTPLDELR